MRLHRLLTTPVTRRAFLRIVHATSHGIHRSSGDSRRRRRRRRRIFSRSLLLTLFSIFFSRRCAVFGVIYLLHDSRRASSLTFRYQNIFPFLLRENARAFVRERSFQSAIFFRKSARLDDLEYKATTTTAKMNAAAAACGRRRRHARAFDTHKKIKPSWWSHLSRRLAVDDDWTLPGRSGDLLQSHLAHALHVLRDPAFAHAFEFRKSPQILRRRRSSSRWQRGVVVPGWSEGRTAASSCLSLIALGISFLYVRKHGDFFALFLAGKLLLYFFFCFFFVSNTNRRRDFSKTIVQGEHTHTHTHVLWEKAIIFLLILIHDLKVSARIFFCVWSSSSSRSWWWSFESLSPVCIRLRTRCILYHT